MDYCPVCGGSTGGAYACPTCGTAQQPLQQTPYPAPDPYLQQTGYPQQDPYAQQAAYAEQLQYHQQTGQAQYAGHSPYPEQVQQQYPPQEQYAEGYPAPYAADPMTVGWHVPEQQLPSEYPEFDATRLQEPVDAAPLGPAEPAGFEPADPASGFAAEEPAGAEAPADDRDGANEDIEAEDPARPRVHGRRGRSRHRTLKLVLGTATGLVLAGGLVTVLPGELAPTGSGSARNGSSQADAQPSDGTGLPSVPAYAVPASAQDVDASAPGRDSSASPKSSSSADASAKPSAHPPAHPSGGTMPTTGYTQPTTPTQSPPPPPPPHSPPPTHHQGHGCVLLCW